MTEPRELEEDQMVYQAITVSDGRSPVADLPITVSAAAEEPQTVDTDLGDALVVHLVDSYRADLQLTRTEFFDLVEDLLERLHVDLRWTLTDREFPEESDCPPP